MNPSPLTLRLDSPNGEYRPGDELSGQFYGDVRQWAAIRAIELSVLWYTAGQGEEDFAVHHFERFVDEPMRRLDLRRPQRFTTVLPTSPLSYEGQIVKVCWCVRARLFPEQGPETVVEVPFRLGEVQPGRPASETDEEQPT